MLSIHMETEREGDDPSYHSRVPTNLEFLHGEDELLVEESIDEGEDEDHDGSDDGETDQDEDGDEEGHPITVGTEDTCSEIGEDECLSDVADCFKGQTSSLL